VRTKTDQVERLLERAERDPGDNALRGVLADALIEAGDPRGELAAVQATRAALDELGSALDAQHRAQVYGPEEKGLDLGTDVGFIDAISLSLDEHDYKAKRTANATFARLLSLRAGRMVQKVTLRLLDTKPAKIVKDVTAVLALLAERAPMLRELDLYVYATDGVVDFDLVPMLARLELKKLALRGSDAMVRSAVAGTLRGITHLELHPYTDKPLTATHVKRLLEGKAFPDLVELTPDLPESVVHKLLESPLAARLEYIDLSAVSVDDKLARKLLASKRKLANLERLVVGAEEMSLKMLRDLRGFCREVRGLPATQELAWLEAKYERVQQERYEEIEE
jgi:hypothetical protein